MISHKIGKIKIDSNHPYLSNEMFQLWENAQVTGTETGWQPIFWHQEDRFSYGYIKTHSYGEYIFDWAWADLFQRCGVPYYPKLVQCLPVTPISAPKFIHPNAYFFEEIYNTYIQGDFSSHHILFSNASEEAYFLQKKYFKQTTLQYHFKNEYTDYENFLGHLKSRRRKNILKERRIVKSYPLTIQRIPSHQLSTDQKIEIYHLYLSTILKKYSQAYLTEKFFKDLNQGFFYLAYKGHQLIAMSCFFEDSDRLYGRYWGIRSDYEREFRYLHFEMCFYLPIEYTINQKLKFFEAGAQGEQKLLRGFTPVEISSLHHIKHPQLSPVIERYISEQNIAYAKEIERLKDFLPFSK